MQASAETNSNLPCRPALSGPRFLSGFLALPLLALEAASCGPSVSFSWCPKMGLGSRPFAALVLSGPFFFWGLRFALPPPSFGPAFLGVSGLVRRLFFVFGLFFQCARAVASRALPRLEASSVGPFRAR